MNPRYSDRKSVSAKVTLSSGPRVGEGQVVDLTVPGCLLQTAMPLERGQDVQLVIYLNELRPMRINLGIVRWVSGKTAGIEFIRMSAADQERLRAFIGYRPPHKVSSSWGETPLCVGTEMSPIEYREAERRIKTMLFGSMVGVFVGLVGATLIESDHRQADPRHPGSVPQNQVHERKDVLNEHIRVEERTHA